jgi:hypothetical protein
MKSFLKEIEDKFQDLEETCTCGKPGCPECNPEGLDEMSATGAVAGFNTPAAFAKPGKWKSKDIKYESVNTPPSFKWRETGYQQPESGEETSQDKFPFSTVNDKWPNKDQEYPVKFSNQPYGTANIKDTTTRVGNLPDTSTPIKKTSNYMQVHEAMDRKYEQLIESYRAFATGDSKLTPEQKVKNTIKEVAKKLQEIETLVNHTSRLKTESGLSRMGIGNAADKALVKISERLTKISERVRALGE